MGAQLRKLLRPRVIVVFGATSRIGRATIETLAKQPQHGVTIVAAVENPKETRARRLKQSTGCYLLKCDFTSIPSMQRVIRNADAVLLIPAISDSGTRFSKRVVDAVRQEEIQRLVLISSVLASTEFWSSGGSTHNQNQPQVSAQMGTTEIGYEAIEAHARSVLPANRCISLRIPLLMETILYCREEIMYANHFIGCFESGTSVPCIAVNDVADAAVSILTQPQKKFNALYTLAQADAMIFPSDIEHLLTEGLGRTIRYRKVSEDRLVEIFHEKGTAEQVAVNLNRYKHLLEATTTSGTRSAPKDEGPDSKPSTAPSSTSTSTSRRLGFTNEFRVLTKRSLLTPRPWLQQHLSRLVRTPQQQIQLFVLGSGEALNQEMERFVAQQVTAPMAIEAPDVGEAALPTSTGVAQQSKTTFCTIKSLPSTNRQRHTFSIPGQDQSPMAQVLDQLSSSDVVVFLPPLRLGTQECMDILRVVLDAAQRRHVWGIVLVSSIFTGHGWNDQLNRMGEMELMVERSGVPYSIVRFPLFMEYFLALSYTLPPSPEGPGATIEEEKQPEATRPTANKPTTQWTLLDRSLATSPQYLIATSDAAKVLVAVAFTFPLHRNKIRTMYTECRTMVEIEAILQKYSYKGAHMDFSKVDGVLETPKREFWRVAYWTRAHVLQFLEMSVRLSGERFQSIVLHESFEEMTECPRMTLEKWAQKNSKCYTASLAVDGSRWRLRSRRRVGQEERGMGAISAERMEQEEEEKQERPVEYKKTYQGQEV